MKAIATPSPISTDRAEQYRKDAIAYHRGIVDTEGTREDEHGWLLLDEYSLRSCGCDRSLAFLVEEGVAERHPAREGVFRFTAEGGAA